MDASPIPLIFVIEQQSNFAESTLEQMKAGEFADAEEQIDGMLTKFKNVFSASGVVSTVQSAIDEFASEKMTLRLVCQYTGEPVGDGYEITAPREVVPKLLPLLSAGLKAMTVIKDKINVVQQT